MAEQCKGDGSIQKLVANKWKVVGIGQLFLLKNIHNPTQILLKLLRNKRNEVHMFQCKPKFKTNGKSLILKGTDTKRNQEFILAVRFKEDDSFQEFQTALQKLYKRNQSLPNKTQSSPKLASHQRVTSEPPKAIMTKLSQYAWDCELCTFRNEPAVFDCEVCKHPRPLREPSIPIMHAGNESALPDDLPPNFTPVSSAVAANKFPDTNGGRLQKLNENEVVMVDIDDYEKDENKDDSKEKEKEEEDGDTEKQSIKQLIISVTNGEEIASIKHTTVEDILLLCHDTFTDAETMMTTLLDRISDANLLDVNARIRGVKMCESWIRNYWESDFEDKGNMIDIMYGFIDGLDKKKQHLKDSDRKLLGRIKSTFEQRMNSAEIEKTRSMATMRSNKILGGVDIPKKYDIMNESAQSIAEQLTLMDFALFKAIEKREMCGQAWKKKDREERAPHLLAMIKQFNHISKWVQCVVLQQKNKRKRSKCIDKFIQIAVHLKSLRNFSGCCAVNFGLSCNNLYRLKPAWNGVSRTELKQFAEIQLLYKGKKNWELLRVLHRNAHAPSILHTGLFLQDLLNTDEGNEDRQKDGTVNFTKLMKTYNLIEQISMYQQSSYFKIKENLVMQEYLKAIWKRQEAYNEEKLYKISTIVKNKDAENKDIDDADVVLMAW